MVFVNRMALIVIGLPRWLAARGPLMLDVVRKAKLLPLLLPLLIYAGAQFYLYRTALSVLDHLIATLPDTVEFRFDQIDTQFDGSVAIEGATLLLPGMSLPVQFQSLRLVSSNWRELSTLASGLGQGLLPPMLQVEFTLAEQELSRLATSSLLPVDATRMALGCFQPAELRAAPKGEALFAGSLEYRFDTRSEYLNARLQLSSEQRYRLDLNADLDIGALQLRLATLDRIAMGGADLHYLNLGAQSDLLRSCGATGRSGLVEGAYVARQSEALKRRLSRQGWRASAELELAYQDYLFLPLQLTLQLTAVKSVKLLELARSPVSWGQFAVRIGLNTSPADHQDLTWSPGAHQRLAAAGARMAEKTGAGVSIAPVTDSLVEVASLASAGPDKKGLEPPTERLRVASEKSPISDAQLQQQLQQTARYQPSYKPVSVTELSDLLGSPMRLTTLNGRRMEGVLERVESDRLQLRSEISQGIAILPVRLDIISAMQAYF